MNTMPRKNGPRPFRRLRAGLVALLGKTAILLFWPAVGSVAAQVPSAATMRLREVARFGDASDAPDWWAFAREPVLFVDVSGRLYVLSQDNDVRLAVFDRDGRFLRYLSGAGEGPGEFRAIMNAGTVGDTIWVEGFMPARLSFFRMDGTHIRTQELRSAYGEPAGVVSDRRDRTVLLADGRALHISRSSVTTPYDRAAIPLMVGPVGPGARDTIASVLSDTEMLVREVGTFSYEPFSTPPLHATLPGGGGVVVAAWDVGEPTGVTIRAYAPDGRRLRQTTIGSSPLKVSVATRRALIHEGVQKARQPWEFHRQNFDGVPDDLEAAVTEGLLLYDYFPPADEVFVTADWQVWLREGAVSGQRAGDWIVVDMGTDNAEVLRVPSPPEVRLQAAHGRWVWGTGRTELDVPFVVRYELVPVARSPPPCC